MSASQFKWLAFGIGILMILKQSSTPRGIRNNNPSNIRFDARNQWRGQIGQDGDGFAVFDTAANGLRAMAKLILNYGRLYQADTIRSILTRWAPPSENKTEAYIQHAVNKLALPDDAPLGMADIARLMDVIILHENGQQPYTAAQIEQGLQDAVA